MEQLTQQDLRVLLGFLKELYTLRDVNAFRAHLLTALPRVVPAEIALYRETDRKKRQPPREMYSPSGANFSDSGRIFAQHMHEHPLFAAYKQGKGSAVQISDFLAREKFRRTGLYNEFFRRLGVEHQIAKGLPAPPSLIRAISLFRTRREFSERDRLVLNLLRFHLIQAYENAEVVTRTQQELHSARQGDEGVERGVIVLAQDGHVRTATSRARQWVAEYFGNSPALPESLPDALQRWVRHQTTLFTNNGDAPSAREPLVVEREGRRLVVRLLSEAEQNLLLVEEHRTRLSPASFSSLRVSPREAEVLVWLTQGRSNHDIGVILGISERTVKKHLEHIFAKLGVWNRTEAAAKALEAGVRSET